MIIVMIVLCLGMGLMYYAIPVGWFSGGIGIALLTVILFACCIAMIKMMLKKNYKDDRF